MITKPALHRVQDLSAQMKHYYFVQELKGDVSLYLELQQAQIDAVEDGENHLAGSIGKHMRSVREKYDACKWEKELDSQNTYN